jgi:DNA-binding transcriptional LysR family regulator
MKSSFRGEEDAAILQSMDTLVNLKTFMAVVRAGSFAAAARDLNVAPSVVTKRITQVEWELRANLFERSTRRVSLSPAGKRFLPAIQRAVADIDDIFTSAREIPDDAQGHLRIKVPSSLGVRRVGVMLNEFQAQYPSISLEVIALDRAVNPVDEGFDLAITIVPSSFGGVLDEPLCRMERVICASPAYLATRKTPLHPKDLLDHQLLHYLPMGDRWDFDSKAGKISIEVRAQYATNVAQLLLSAAIYGNGITVLGDYVVNEPIAEGTLVALLQDYPMPPVWIRALIPESKAQFRRVRIMLDWLKERFAEPLDASW